MSIPTTEQRRTQQIVDLLNAYKGDNIWQDVIWDLPEYDDEATSDEVDQGRNDGLVLTNGTVIAYRYQDPAGWYER